MFCVLTVKQLKNSLKKAAWLKPVAPILECSTNHNDKNCSSPINLSGLL